MGNAITTCSSSLQTGDSIILLGLSHTPFHSRIQIRGNSHLFFLQFFIEINASSDLSGKMHMFYFPEAVCLGRERQRRRRARRDQQKINCFRGPHILVWGPQSKQIKQFLVPPSTWLLCFHSCYILRINCRCARTAEDGCIISMGPSQRGQSSDVAPILNLANFS